MARPTADAPRIAAVEVALPPHVYRQDEIVSAFAPLGGPAFVRFSANTGVRQRHLALPLERYFELSGFTEANDAWLETALQLGEQAIRSALDSARVRPAEVDLIVSTTVTGLTVPSLEARLAQRLGLRPDVKRMPLFGLGCVAGAAGVARVNDYLRGYPDQTAVLLAVELCSLTVQTGDTALANMVATSLFGDGAAAVVMKGARRGSAGPGVLASRSRLYPDTEKVMGWDIGSHGFKIVLSAEVAPIAEKYLGDDVRGFLKDRQLELADVASWICHPGGPKVIEAVQKVLELPRSALDRTRQSLAERGNLSSVSVLDVLRATMAAPPHEALGMMIAMGPGFCAEMVLLEFP